MPVFFKIGSQTGQEQSQQLAIAVNPLNVGNDTQIAPIKDIIEEPLKFEDFLPYLIGLVVLVAIGLLVYYFVRRARNKEVPPPPEIILPAHEIALEKLDELDKAKLWQQGMVKEFQSNLTYIVREYLENRFKVKALESTTDEILVQFKSMEIKETWKEKLSAMLRTADLVKFAKAEPSVEVHQKGLEEAEGFIQDTKKTWKEEEEQAELPENSASSIAATATTIAATAAGAVSAAEEEE